MSDKTCVHCGKEVEKYLNYCNWSCHIEAAFALGGVAHLPNGLPIMCIKHDGSMYEHEHGDHPDYKFPVKVEYVGVKEELPDWDDSYCDQVHALIYTDGVVAITLYECCYSTWFLRDGHGTGSLWKMSEWKLKQESIDEIRSKFPRDR